MTLAAPGAPGFGQLERSGLLGVDARAMADLHAAGPLLRANADRIVDELCRRIAASPWLRHLTDRHSSLERLRGAMLGYVAGIPDMRFDAGHVASRQKIAKANEVIGLPTDAFHSQLATIREVWVDIVLESGAACGRPHAESAAHIRAVDRVLSFDEGVVTLYFTDVLRDALKLQAQYELVRETAAAIFAGSLDSSETIHAVTDAARRALGADRVSCYVHSADQTRIDEVVTTEQDPERRRFLEAVVDLTRPEIPIWDYFLARPEPVVWVEDVAAATDLPGGLRRRLGAGAFLGVRVDHAALEGDGGERVLLGTLFASWSTPRAFGRQDELNARNLAGLAAMALANARMLAARRQLELELRQAQKMEAVGQLAAGVAHEINTPIQFVGDSAHFLREAFADLQGLIETYRALAEAAAAGTAGPQMVADLAAQEEELDLAFLSEQIPKAIERTLEGSHRVAEIVRAMKDFAHPSQDQQAAADLNRAILSTLTVASNELKYVADVETDLAPLPPVVCHIGDLNQVVLNLVVNAAHAIADTGGEGEAARGTIRVATALEGDSTVLIRVCDTGGGIPEEIRDRIFDPFFTTKEVGRGTGQGLALTYALVCEKHGGSVRFDTEIGLGTTFEVRLPLAGRPVAS